MINIKATVINANNDVKIEFYEDEKKLFVMEHDELEHKINKAIIREFDKLQGEI